MFKLSDPANNKFDIWLKANGIYVAIAVAAALIITIGILIVLSFKKKSDSVCSASKPEVKGNLKDFVGGGDNIISVTKTGSRIALELKDYSLVNESELKNAGVLSFIKMSKKITLVCNKGDVDNIFNSLN